MKEKICILGRGVEDSRGYRYEVKIQERHRFYL